MNKPPKIFITYAHNDKEAKERLIKQLAVMKRNKEIDVWHDNEMLAGDRWEDTISNQLAKSNILLYLTSASSLASTNCNKELSEALEGKKIRIIPIILEDCDWKNHQLGKFEVLPAKGKPINQWDHEADGWQNVVVGIRKIINEDGAEGTLVGGKSPPGGQPPYGTQAPSPHTDVTIMLDNGNFFMMLGQLDLAIKNFSEVIKLEPENALAYNSLGIAYGKKGEHSHAIKNFSKAIGFKLDNAEVYTNRGIAYDNNHEHKRALEDFNSAIRKIIQEIIEKSTDGDYIYRGEPECYKKVSSNLYRQYEKIIKTKDFDIKVVQKEILEKAKQYTDETNKLAIQRELQHYGGKTNLIDFTTDYLIALFFACDGSRDKDGRVIFRKRNFTAKEEKINKLKIPKHRVIAQKSIFVEPPEGYIKPDKFIVITRDLKQPMLDYLDKHHNISPPTIYNDLHGFIKKPDIHQSAYTKFHEGVTLSDQSEYDEAIEHYNQSIEFNPDNASAYNNRGIAYDNNGDYDRAIQDYSKAIELNPDYASAYGNRGLAHFDNGEYDLAMSDFNKAIDLNPDFAEAYYNRGNAYAAKGAFDLAGSDYSKTIELNPDLSIAYHNRGNTYIAKGKYDLAIQDFNKAIALNPDDIFAHFNRAIIHLVLHNWENTKTDLTTAKRLGLNIASAFQEAFRSIQQFEKQFGITLPSDIRKLLEPSDSDS